MFEKVLLQNYSYPYDDIQPYGVVRSSIQDSESCDVGSNPTQAIFMEINK